MTGTVSTRRFRLPLKEPFVTGSSTITTREGIAVALRSDGQIGIGEATPLPEWTEDIAETRRSLEAFTVEDRPYWAALLPPDHPAARHALHLSITDLAAQQANQSLAEYLGGNRSLDTISVNATVGDGPVAATVNRVVSAIEDGYATVKVKVGRRAPATTVERIERLAPLCDEAEIRLDANQAWDVRTAQQVIDIAGDAGISLLEEPLANPTPERLARLQSERVEIALDESVSAIDSADRERWFAVTDAVVLKPMVLGGIDRAISLATAARTAGVDAIVSNTVDGVVARSAAVHLAAAIQCERACGLATGELLRRDLAKDVVPVRNGTIDVPTIPGLGTQGPWEQNSDVVPEG